MYSTNEQQAEKDTQKIVLKKDCWIETNFGVFRIKEEFTAEAVPVFFSNGELAGYRFSSSSYAGATYDLERIVVLEDERNSSSELQFRKI